MNVPILSAKDLSVFYGSKVAVDKIEFEVSSGQVLALLGLNGAGKTTTLRAVLGMLKINAGKINLLGKENKRHLAFKDLGYAPEEALPPDFQTCREYLRFVASFREPSVEKRLKEVGHWLSWFELEPEKKIKQLSKGMRRKLLLAQAFLAQPKLLILDEPWNGLDPIYIKKLRELIETTRKTNTGVIVSSHILSEIEKIATHVLILHKGKVQLYSSLENVKEKFGSVEEAFASLAAEGQK